MRDKKLTSQPSTKEAALTPMESGEIIDFNEDEISPSPNLEHYAKLFRYHLGVLRTELEVSEKDMSRELGMGDGYIAGLASGRNLPSMSLFFRIADYFEVSPQIFFEEEGKALPKVTRDLIREIKQLDLDTQSQLLGLLLLMKKPESEK